MPLHEYQCDVCGRRFEKIQKFSDPPIEICPTCGGHVHKLISSPAFHLKGSGWYATDYAKKDSTDGKTTGESKGESVTAKDGGSSEKVSSEKKDTAEKKSDSSSSSTTTDASTKSPAKDTKASSKDKSD
jgi:putative FmdB family regulatory protein